MRRLEQMQEVLSIRLPLSATDPELMRAQYREFAHQVPLLYLVLSFNAALTAWAFTDTAGILGGYLPALCLCTIATFRGIQWSRRRDRPFSDKQISRQVSTTSLLAILLTVGYMLWGTMLYPYGSPAAQSQLLFGLGLSHVCTVFCLMPLRVAALASIVVSTALFVFFCLTADPGKLTSQAVMLTLLSIAMMFVLYRQDRAFGELIASRRELAIRHLQAERLGEENKQIALTDALSGLPNRRAFLAQLEALGARFEGKPDTLGIAFIDLDGFKAVNDAHGHQMGDLLIRTLSEILTRLLPPGATLVRMGGDEFAILMVGPAAQSETHRFCESAAEAIKQPIKLIGTEIRIGASIGYASDETGDAEPFEILRRADAAMYSVKAAGTGGVRRYDNSIDFERTRRRQLEEEIAAGLQRNEFELAYQPVIDAKTMRVVSLEALIRWPRRPAGIIDPDQFIAVAETSGLIHSMGLFVLERACRDASGHPGLNISVNVSPSQLIHTEFAGQVLEVLERERFEPKRLQLEVTERTLIEHPQRAKESIDTLKRAGVSFALDDFGTGFTSLAYLQSYGFNTVKMDRSLIEKVGSSPQAMYLVSGLVQMAKGLEVKVVAEGIETRLQSQILRTAGCAELQGYYFARPAQFAEAIRIVETADLKALSA